MKDEEKNLDEEMKQEVDNKEVEEILNEMDEVNDTLDPLQQENEDLKAQLKEKEDQVYRLAAEMKNIQSRNAQERQNAAKYRSQSLATKLLAVIDNLERALEVEADDEVSQNLKKGIEMVYDNLMEALKAEGVEVINPLGEIFDPNFHQSVSSLPIEEGQKENEIVQVYQKGYVLKDRVLRPAMVVVAQ